MSVAGCTTQHTTQQHSATRRTSRRDTSDHTEWLEIEIVRDEHYRQNGVYCSWQDIVAGETSVSPGTSRPLLRGDSAAGQCYGP